MKKSILITFLIVIVILGIFFIVKNTTKNKYNYDIEKISQYNYYVFKENGNSGIIDREGNKIIDAIYSNIIIPNPRKRYIYLL